MHHGIGCVTRREQDLEIRSASQGFIGELSASSPASPRQ